MWLEPSWGHSEDDDDDDDQGQTRINQGPNQANCEDLSSETGPKPGETRGETRQIVRMSQAGRAAQPGQTRPNQGPNQADWEDVLDRNRPN